MSTMCKTQPEHNYIPLSFPNPRRNERFKHDQKAYKRRVRDFYAADKLKINGVRRIWCPITQIFVPSYLNTTAQIIPYSIGAENAAYLLGRDKDEGWEAIWDPRNAMPLAFTMRREFDCGNFVIVPDVLDNWLVGSVAEYKLVVLNEELLNRHKMMRMDWRELDGKRLMWLNEKRPERKYLYFRFVFAMLQREKRLGREWDKDRFRKEAAEIWDAPMQWLRDSVLVHLAVGLKVVKTTREFEGALEGTFYTQQRGAFKSAR